MAYTWVIITNEQMKNYKQMIASTSKLYIVRQYNRTVTHIFIQQYNFLMVYYKKKFLAHSLLIN